MDDDMPMRAERSIARKVQITAGYDEAWLIANAVKKASEYAFLEARGMDQRSRHAEHAMEHAEALETAWIGIIQAIGASLKVED